MSDYTIIHREDTPNFMAENGWPGDMRFLGKPSGSTQLSFTYRRMPEHSGGKGGYGHFHKTQEEIIYVISGRVELKLDDEVVEVGAGSVVRIAPAVVRSIWNARPEDAELLLFSVHSDDPRDDAEMVADFWPDE